MTCPTCEHADAHGWFGLRRGTHCRRCHRTWTAPREAHCTLCCRHFSTGENADAHVGSSGCVDPATLCDKRHRPRFKLADRPSGPTWRGAGAYDGPREPQRLGFQPRKAARRVITPDAASDGSVASGEAVEAIDAQPSTDEGNDTP